MGDCRSSAAERVFALPELLEQILTLLLGQLLPLTDQEDPRSRRVHSNARILSHLLRCTEVSRDWRRCIFGSGRLQRALFHIPDNSCQRSWTVECYPVRGIPNVYAYDSPSLRAPQLNPIIQTTFAKYHFRFWNVNLELTGNKHCAYLIIARRDVAAVNLRLRTGQGWNISSMLLSQPPCTALNAMIWEERDETKDYVGKTSFLRDSSIRCDSGLTIGNVHERVVQMFDEHPDVAAIKLTTA